MMNSRSVWDLRRYCRCVKVTAQRCSASIRRRVLPGSLACCRVISALSGRLWVFSRHDRMARCKRRKISTRYANITGNAAQSTTSRTLLFIRLFAGRHAGTGDRRALTCQRRDGCIPRSVGYRPPETQNWQEKRGQWVGSSGAGGDRA